MQEDLRSGFRQIGRNPGFSAAVILTLALGVGAPTAVFTLADPLSFARSAGLRRTPLEHADAPRSRNARGAIPRDDFLACDP
jgi:hypothetical protein